MSERRILGLTESVILIAELGEEQVLARIDTGATSSSIDLKLAQKLGLGPIHKSNTVRSASGMEERPFVRAKVKINDYIIEGEFSLADRRHMTYKVLIGQNVLKKGKFLIDPLKRK